MSAFNAWVLLKGLETLALRVDAGCRAAETIAEFLAGQSGVTRVWYPTRADHPQRDLAMKQMSAGGTVVTFEVAGGKAGAFRVMNAFQLIAVSNNLGDSKSLATHPATTTHMRIGEAERAKLGISDGVIRLSVGLEDPEDIKDDLARALTAANRRARSEASIVGRSHRCRVFWPDTRFALLSSCSRPDDCCFCTRCTTAEHEFGRSARSQDRGLPRRWISCVHTIRSRSLSRAGSWITGAPRF